jgi:hypothetical protein
MRGQVPLVSIIILRAVQPAIADYSKLHQKNPFFFLPNPLKIAMFSKSVGVRITFAER